MMREFTVAVFVVDHGRVLLHWHRKLQRWLPPGGHVEPGELPDEAAVRETQEETGLEIVLIDTLPAGPPSEVTPVGETPKRLTQPLGIQLETIAPGHEHIDLIYVACLRPGTAAAARAATDDPASRPGWYTPADLPSLGATAEVARWAAAAVQAAVGRQEV